MRTAAHRTMPTALAAALVVLALSGCSLTQLQDLLPREETRDDTGSITQGGSTDVFQLRKGDCLNDAEVTDGSEKSGGAQLASEISQAPTVPCGQPHDLEVYTLIALTGDAYPGDDRVDHQADELCRAAFTGFVGHPYDDSHYDFTHYTPTQDSWATGDRTVNCLIGDPDGKTAGSLAGVGR